MPYYRKKYYRSKRIRVSHDNGSTWKDYVWTGTKWVLGTAAGIAAGYYGGALGREVWGAAREIWNNHQVPEYHYPTHNSGTWERAELYPRNQEEAKAYLERREAARRWHEKVDPEGAKRLAEERHGRWWKQ